MNGAYHSFLITLSNAAWLIGVGASGLMRSCSNLILVLQVFFELIKFKLWEWKAMEEVLLGTQSRCTSMKRCALKFISPLVDRRWLVTRRSVFCSIFIEKVFLRLEDDRDKTDYQPGEYLAFFQLLVSVFLRAIAEKISWFENELRLLWWSISLLSVVTALWSRSMTRLQLSLTHHIRGNSQSTLNNINLQSN